LDREALSEPWHRLGCQARVLGDVVVRVPETKWEAPNPARVEAQGVDIQ
jgi:2Fe-2S ferredoxin